MKKIKNLVPYKILILLSLLVIPKEILASRDLALDSPYPNIEAKTAYLHSLGQDLAGSSSNNAYGIYPLRKSDLPDLVVFLASSPEEPRSSLSLYGFLGARCQLIHKLYLEPDLVYSHMELGLVKGDQAGIYLNSRNPRGQSVNSGFIVYKNRLVEILSHKKTRLTSDFTSMPIRNSNGILEYSIGIVNPENKDQKIELWYRWDGVASSRLIETNYRIKSSESYLGLLELTGQEDFLQTLLTYEDQLDKFQLSSLISQYLTEGKDRAYGYIASFFPHKITQELYDYMDILNEYYNHIFLENDQLIITRSELLSRLISLDDFSFTYPYSPRLEDISKLKEVYANIYFFEDYKKSLVLRPGFSFVSRL